MALLFGGSSETILLVEDHPALLKLVKQILEDAHFTVIPASNAKQAIRIEGEYPGTIDLLLSGVKIRGMSGPDLAHTLKERRPQMRVMLMSGYPGGALLVLNYGWHYIERPSVPSMLVSKIKEVLRGQNREQSTDRFDAFSEPRRPFGRARRAFHPPLPSRAQRRA